MGALLRWGRAAIVYSVRDPAGRGAGLKLAELLGAEEASCGGAVECYSRGGEVVVSGFEADPVEMEFLDYYPSPHASFVIVLSRHRSESARRALTVHHTGNPGSRVLGGERYRLSVSYPQLSKALLASYAESVEELGLGGYEVVLEATHHGPTRPSKPVVFAEIGSTHEDWADERLHEALARAVLAALERGPPECTPAAAFGGSHYPVKFTRMQLESEYCLGHIISKHALREGPRRDVIEQAIERAWPERARVVIMEKLRREHRELVKSVASELGVDVIVV